eukprot:s218_g20.t1
MEVAAMDAADPLQIRYNMQFSELLQLTLIYIGITAIGQIVAIPVSWLMFPRSRNMKQRGEPGGDLWAADAICLLLFSFSLLPSAFGSIANLSTSVDARWNGTCWSSIHGCLLLCTRLFVHIPFLFWKGLNASRKRILVHHVMVILVYGTGLLKGSMHFWGAAAGLCEFSNMFLANIELVKCCSTVHQNQIKQSVLYKLNSALLSLAYICCRLVLFPAVLAALLTDAYTHPELTVRSSMVEWVMMPMSICCVWAMSAFEFRNIFEGTFKALDLDGSKASKFMELRSGETWRKLFAQSTEHRILFILRLSAVWLLSRCTCGWETFWDMPLSLRRLCLRPVQTGAALASFPPNIVMRIHLEPSKAMQHKSMVSRGMAVLGAGGQCTREAHLRDNTMINEGTRKSDRSSQYRYHVDFNSDVPAETAELWVGTPYAAWIEKDVQRRYAKEYTKKVQDLEQRLDNEERRRRVLEAQLEEANEQLKQIPQLQEQLLQSKLLMLKQVEKGVAAVGLGNLHAVCRVVLSEWRRLATGNIVDRLRRRAPDVGRCHFEMVQLHEEGMEHLKALHLRMLNTVERFMDKDAMIIREKEEPWPCSVEKTCEVRRHHQSISSQLPTALCFAYTSPVFMSSMQRRSFLAKATRPRKLLCRRPLEFPGLQYGPEDNDLLLPIGCKFSHGMAVSKLGKRLAGYDAGELGEPDRNVMKLEERTQEFADQATTKLPPVGRSNSLPCIEPAEPSGMKRAEKRKPVMPKQLGVTTKLPPLGRSNSLPCIAPAEQTETKRAEKRKPAKPTKRSRVRFNSQLNEEFRLIDCQESWV